MDKIKKVTETPRKWIHDVSVLAALVSGTAAALKVATEPMVKTGLGQLPIWQIVAAVLGAVILGYVFVLQNKRG